MAEPKPPATGETNAITGFWTQYEYSASVIFRLMQEGILEAIYVSDPTAGIFDDLVVHAKGELQATQVKSEKSATYVSLATELKGSKIRDMAGSWLALRRQYQTDNVRLRYIFPGLLSTGDTALANAGTSGARHSAAFAEFVSRNDLSQEVIAQSIWSDSLAAFQERSGLEVADFIAFLRQLELKDERELLAQRLETFQPADRKQVEAIQALLPVLVATSTAGQKWSEQELLNRLGWRSRLAQHNVHVFPVPSDYQENEATERKLIEVIRTTTQGYVALVGPPGTGKSTLLQRALHSTPHFSVSRYLAFHPDQRHGLGRAEAGEFLNDLIAELRSQGLYASRLATDNLSGLRTELTKQLLSARDRFEESGRKTVIIIDGLDHVPREETPTVSFLPELPAAASIPEGVIVILGTQRIELPGLHPTIIQQAREPGRTVVIDPLTKAAVFSLADAAKLPKFVERETLFDRTKGHPLTARYFIDALKQATDSEQAEAILSDIDGLGHSLEQIYERVWNKLDTARSARAVLALLARAEGTLSAAQLASATNDESVEDVLATASFLLLKDPSTRFSIFHNSFRLFVSQATGKKFGEPNPDLEVGFNHSLAEIARASASDDPQHWFQLRYWSRAGVQDKVLALGVPEYFRRSLRVFRPSGEIYTDLRLTYGAVKSTRDRVLLLNKLLIEKEIDYRLEAVSDLDFVDLLIDLGDIELATRHALEVGESSEGWLTLVDHYWDKGEVERARQIFEANEPLEVLFANAGFDPHQEMKRAQGWVQRAQRFRPMEKLAAIIDSLVVKSHWQNEDNADEGQGTRSSLKFSLALGAVRDARVRDIQELKLLLSLDEEQVACLQIEAAELAFNAKRFDDARFYLSAAQKTEALGASHPSWRRAAAFIARKVQKLDYAKELAASLTIPRLDREGSVSEDMGSLSRAIVETTFLGSALEVDITEEERPARPDRSPLLTATHAKLRELGVLRATAKKQDAAVSTKALHTIVHFLAHAKSDQGDHNGYRFYGMLGDIPRFLLRPALEAGEGVFDDVLKFVDDKLAQGDNNLSRSEAFRLNFARAAFEVDRNVDAAKARIDLARAIRRVGRTPQEAVDTCTSLARAYCRIGKVAEAREVLDTMHQDTFGYWLRAKKEPQYSFWAWSFLKACEAAPSAMEVPALKFAQFILGMDQTEGDETASRVLDELLGGAGASPRALAGIVDRLLDSDLATWARICEMTLVSVAKQAPSLASPILLVCAQLLVPFSNGGIKACLEATLPTLSPAARALPIQTLLASVQRWCPPSEREIILREIVAFAPETEAAVNAAVSAAQNVTAELQHLTHGDPAVSSKDTGVSIDIEVDTLAQLLAQGEGKSDYGDRIDYSYARAAERLAPNSTKAELDEFLEHRPHLEADAKFMAITARRLLELGHRSAALQCFSKAENAAFSGHWSMFMGGQKLVVQRLRLDLDGPSAIETGFDILLDELASGQTHGSSLFLNMEEVLEVVASPIPFAGLWSETQAHLEQYREFRLAEPVKPVEDICTHSDVIAFLLSKAFGFNCPEVTAHARKAVLHIGRSTTDSALIEKLLQLVQDLPDGAREATALLDRLRQEPHLKELIKRESLAHATDEDFVVATLAKRCLSDLGEPHETTPVPLPAFYQIISDQSDQAYNFDPPPGLLSGQRPVWSDDPWTWTTMLRGPLRLLSDASDFSLELLRRRCASLMAREGGRIAFGPEVEAEILARLRRLHLQFAYRRPMATSALRAFGRVLQELDAAHAVDPQVFHVLWDEIGGPPLSDYTVEDEPRPAWLPSPSFPRQRYGGIDLEQWLQQAEAMACSPLLQDDFLLAEQSYFIVQASRASADITRSILPHYADLTKGVDSLPRLFSWDNLRPMYSRRDSQIVCRISGSLFEDFSNQTMTVCPYLAKDLGWKRTASNPLDLRDGQGNRVATTIRWIEGTHRRQPSYDAELFGRGQAVILTKIGREQLVGFGVKLSLGAKIEATVTGEGDKTDRRDIVAI